MNIALEASMGEASKPELAELEAAGIFGMLALSFVCGFGYHDRNSFV